MRRKRYLYHVTKPENVGNILKFGLMRSMGWRTTCAVYLSEKPLSWYQPGLDILRVDVSGLAEWLAEVLFHCSNTICDERCPMYKCCCDQPNGNIEDWLKQEAES